MSRWEYQLRESSFKMGKLGFEEQLTGGHHNSLGNTDEVAHIVLQNHNRIHELFDCYNSEDAVVRLRTSSAFKRIFRSQPEWFKPFVHKFFSKIPKLKQPSAEWTLSQICLECEEQLTPNQLKKAKELLKGFLTNSTDWIVLNTSIETLSAWAEKDSQLKKWLMPKLKKLTLEERKSVAKRAQKALDKLKSL